jgi:streptomycin 6-kinase
MWDWFDRYEQPMDRGIVAQADDLLTSLTSSSTDTVLLHGDLGPGNVVLSERGWLAIDPDPVLGDRAFDVRQVLSLRDLRDAREQVAFFADRLDLDARRIAGWTYARCVEFALRCRSVGDTKGLHKYLHRTEQLSSQRLV